MRARVEKNGCLGMDQVNTEDGLGIASYEGSPLVGEGCRSPFSLIEKMSKEDNEKEEAYSLTIDDHQ